MSDLPVRGTSIETLIERFGAPFRFNARETQILTAFGHGLHAKEVAHRLLCSEKTVYAHVARACRKAGCRDYRELTCALLRFCCQFLPESQREHAIRNDDHAGGGILRNSHPVQDTPTSGTPYPVSRMG